MKTFQKTTVGMRLSEQLFIVVVSQLVFISQWGMRIVNKSRWGKNYRAISKFQPAPLPRVMNDWSRRREKYCNFIERKVLQFFP